MEKGELIESLRWSTKWRLLKVRDPDGKFAKFMQQGGSTQEAERRFKDQILQVEEWRGNLGLQEGRQELIRLIAATDGSPVKWDNTNARLGVGNSATAPADTQTGLLGASKDFHAMDATYPQRSNQTCEWRATYGDGHAEFAWEEYTVVNAADDTGVNLNRCTSSKGTKGAGESWTLSLQITFNAS
jgi:hypothetical protein